MDIVKKNLISIISGAVVLLAVVALYLPLGGMKDDLQAELVKSQTTAKSIADLRGATFVWPVVLSTTDKKTEQMKLPGFPNSATLAEAQKVIGKVRAFSEDSLVVLVDLASMGRRPLTDAWKAAPANAAGRVVGKAHTPSGGEAYTFRTEYRKAMQGLLDELKAISLPTDEERKQAEKAIEEQFQKNVRVGPGGQVITDDAAAREKDAAIKAIEGGLVATHASAGRLYVGLAGKGGLCYQVDVTKDGRAPDPEELWFAQVMYWIQEDIVDAICATNQAALARLPLADQNVRFSAIKHLLEILIPEEYIGAAGPISKRTASGGGGGMPPAGFGAPGGGMPGPGMGYTGGGSSANESFQRSFTGRICCSSYDVIHFDMKVVIDPRYISDFIQRLEGSEDLEFGARPNPVKDLKDALADPQAAKRTRAELPHHHAITVLTSQVRRVDPRESAAQGYIYGPGAKDKTEIAPVITVVELSLKCEVLFFREQPDLLKEAPAGQLRRLRPVNQWMPAEVKDTLGIKD